MPQRSAPEDYTPYPTVQAGGGGGTPMSTHASPEDFGSQVGAAEENAGNKGFDFAQKQQGMINETNALNADTALSQKLGALHGQFMSLTGQQAYDQKDAYLKQAQDAVNETRTTLHGQEAIHSYDMLAERRLGSVTQDWEGYAAGQVKQGNEQAWLGHLHASTLRAADPNVALDDQKFGEQVTGPIKYAATSMLNESQPGFKTDSETGKVNFDSTPIGQNAKAQFQSNLDNYLGQAYIQRYNTISDTVGPHAAMQKFQEDKDRIPPFAQVQIQSQLEPKIFSANTSTVVNTAMGEARQDYQQKLLNPNSDISDVIHQQESSGKPHDYQIQPDTFKQYAKAGESPNNPQDQDAVYGRIIKDLKESYPNDPARQAVAYFSGKGNVAPAGNSTPWLEDKQDKNGKTVSSYVQDINTRMGQTPKPYATNALGGRLTDADYYQGNRETVIAGARAWAEKTDPGNLRLSQAAVQRVNQEMDAAIRDQNGQLSQYKNIIQRASDGEFTQGKLPTSEELYAMPQIKDAIHDVSVHDSTDFMRRLDERLAARGSDKDSKTYGAGYMETMKGIHPVDGSAPTITNTNQLYDLYYQGKITDAGRSKLEGEFTNAKKDPAGAAALAAKTSLYDSLHKQVSFQDISNKASPVYDPVGEARYAQAIPLMDAQLEKNREAKIPDDQSFDSNDKNYIGNAARPFMRTPSELLIARRTSSLQAQGLNANDNPVFVRPIINKLSSGELAGDKAINAILGIVNKGMSIQTARSLLLKYNLAQGPKEPISVPLTD